MSTTTTTVILLLSVLSSFTTNSATATGGHHHHHHHHHRRHLLHQPFFPQIVTIPPTQAPSLSPQPQPQPQPQQPQTQPKYPFSTTPNTPQRPFFPTFPSPPPPPPPLTTLATFPANISSLLFPHHPSSPSFSHRHLIIVAISISLSLLFVATLAALSAFFLYSRRGYHHHYRNTTTTSEKTSRSDSLRLFPQNTLPSDGSPPKLPPHRPVNSGGVSSTSSEFLYLGTLVNSRAGFDDHERVIKNLAMIGGSSGISSSPYQKLGSPELKPLPPLPKHNFSPSYRSGEVLVNSFNEDSQNDGNTSVENAEEEEEFFSPRCSSGRKESPVRVGSSSRREFQGLQGETFGSRSFNSRTASYPQSNSCSPVNNSVSTSPSVVLSNVSIRSTKSDKDLEVITGFTATVHSLKRSSPSLSYTSGGDSGDGQNFPARNSGSLEQNGEAPAKIESVVGNQVVPKKLPPPPPPTPPPLRFWEIPKGVSAASELKVGSSGPAVLVTPSRPVLVQNPIPGFANEQSVERSEETPRPKLKPLHWDKVRASSDRVMVWDQIKFSSFQ